MRYTRGYRILLKVPPRYRYVYTLAVCLALLSVWLFGIYMPFDRTIQHRMCEIKQCKKDRDTYIEQQAACKKMTDDIERLNTDMHLLFDPILSISDHIASIMRYVGEVGLKLISLRVADRKDHGWYTSERMIFEAAGNLSAIIRFFALCNEHQMLLQCDEMSLDRQSEDIFLLHGILRVMLIKAHESTESKSPSTLKKAEGLGG